MSAGWRDDAAKRLHAACVGLIGYHGEVCEHPNYPAIYAGFSIETTGIPILGAVTVLRSEALKNPGNKLDNLIVAKVKNAALSVMYELASQGANLL